MARRAVRIPPDLQYKQIHAVINHNDRNKGSLGAKTLDIIMDHGPMYIEEYIDLCESQGISPQQATKELRVDLGFQRIALEGFPEFIDPFYEDQEENAETNEVSQTKYKNLPRNLADLEDELKRKSQDYNTKLQSLDFQEANMNRRAERNKRLSESILKHKDELKKEEEVNEQIFKQASSLLEEAKKGIEAGATVADPKKHNGIIHPPEWNKLVKLAELRQNIMLTGPSGCGKTHNCEILANHLELDFGFISCTSGISESEFRGRIIPNISDGSINYIPSIFVKLYEHGGVLLLDELDAADGNTIIFINTALANKQMYIDIREKNPIVSRHPDFICVAATNTLGHGADDDYTERNMLDLATLDRFRAGIIEMDYSVEVEELLVNKHVLDWGLKVRGLIKEHRYQHTMSTRVMIEYSKQADEYGWGRKEWERSYFADWSEDEIRIAKSKGVMINE